MKQIVKKSIGIICIILGFLALVTPFTPGSWLILIGLEILGLQFLLGGRFSRFLKKKRKDRVENSVTKPGQKERDESCEAGQRGEKRKSA
jgi:hypothetical protein